MKFEEVLSALRKGEEIKIVEKSKWSSARISINDDEISLGD